MPTISSFAEANKALEPFWGRQVIRAARSLDHMQRLMTFLGNPQDTLRVVHVAGTSGKTSTAYYTAALLQAAGKKVGLTVGPHLQEVNERVQLNGKPLDEATFCRNLGHFLDRIADSGVAPTYFEVLIAFAFTEYAAYGVDYAVIEVGIGGLEDTTNVISREDKTCIITDIGFDHTKLLGNTLPEIAAQKAGIIQLHSTVFCHRQSEEIMTPIRDRSRQKQADLHILSPVRAPAKLAFLPMFQRRNFMLAQQAVEYILTRAGAKLTPTAIDQAAHTTIPGRMELLHIGGKTVVLDGAHNPQKMQLLMESLHEAFGSQPIAALVSFAPGLTRGTNILRILHKHLHHLSTTVYGTPLTPYSSMTPRDMRTACQRAGITAYEPIDDAQAAVQLLLARPEHVLVITGSFFLLSEVRQQLLARAS
jgi:dihydrofolate synthase / folylpolyglutamate synthase